MPLTNKSSRVHSIRKQPSPEGMQPKRFTGLPLTGTSGAASKVFAMRLAIFTLTEAVEKLSDIQISEFTHSNSLPTQCFAVRANCLPSGPRSAEKLQLHTPKAYWREPDSIMPDSVISDVGTFATFDRSAKSWRSGFNFARASWEKPSGFPSADHENRQSATACQTGVAKTTAENAAFARMLDFKGWSS